MWSIVAQNSSFCLLLPPTLNDSSKASMLASESTRVGVARELLRVRTFFAGDTSSDSASIDDAPTTVLARLRVVICSAGDGDVLLPLLLSSLAIVTRAVAAARSIGVTTALRGVLRLRSVDDDDGVRRLRSNDDVNATLLLLLLLFGVSVASGLPRCCAVSLRSFFDDDDDDDDVVVVTKRLFSIESGASSESLSAAAESGRSIVIVRFFDSDDDRRVLPTTSGLSSMSASALAFDGFGFASSMPSSSTSTASLLRASSVVDEFAPSVVACVAFVVAVVDVDDALAVHKKVSLEFANRNLRRQRAA